MRGQVLTSLHATAVAIPGAALITNLKTWVLFYVFVTLLQKSATISDCEGCSAAVKPYEEFDHTHGSFLNFFNTSFACWLMPVGQELSSLTAIASTIAGSALFTCNAFLLYVVVVNVHRKLATASGW